MKHNSLKRIGLGTLIGLGVLVAVVWLLSLTLGNSTAPVYAGKPITYWRDQLNGRDAGASNAAFTIVSSQVIPVLTDRLFHDTNDSRLRMSLIETLNQLPGIYIFYVPAGGRRAGAAQCIGELGPPARAAVPVLIQALKSADLAVHEAAVGALGQIHSDPDVVIPLLIACLDDENVNDDAARALGNYGSLAKAAVPKILPMLRAPDKDARAAAHAALEQIDPEALLNATKRPRKAAVTNSPPPQTQTQTEAARPGKSN